jgi:hypothetical protein
MQEKNPNLFWWKSCYHSVLRKRLGFYLGWDNEKNPNVWIFFAILMPLIA